MHSARVKDRKGRRPSCGCPVSDAKQDAHCTVHSVKRRSPDAPFMRGKCMLCACSRFCTSCAVQKLHRRREKLLAISSILLGIKNPLRLAFATGYFDTASNAIFVLHICVMSGNRVEFASNLGCLVVWKLSREF